MIAINSMPDHLHLFIGFRPNQSLSDLMRLVKGKFSEWINNKQFTPSTFRWQEGYGAFSYSRSHVQPVTDYIMNQEEYHRKRIFLKEYQQFFEQFEVEY
jgi:putative transposase